LQEIQNEDYAQVQESTEDHEVQLDSHVRRLDHNLKNIFLI